MISKLIFRRNNAAGNYRFANTFSYFKGAVCCCKCSIFCINSKATIFRTESIIFAIYCKITFDSSCSNAISYITTFNATNIFISSIEFAFQFTYINAVNGAHVFNITIFINIEFSASSLNFTICIYSKTAISILERAIIFNF